MISRWQENNLIHGLKVRRGIHLTGARQVGKTTLAEAIGIDSVVHRSLDKSSQVRAAKSDPELFVRRKGQTGRFYNRQLMCNLRLRKFHGRLLDGSTYFCYDSSIKEKGVRL